MIAALTHHVIVIIVLLVVISAAVVCTVVVGRAWPIVYQVVGEVERLQLVIAEVCVAVACLHPDTFAFLHAVVVRSSCPDGLV